jgi:hypothetical protein
MQTETAKLSDLLTTSQLELFLSVLDQVITSGYGSITLVVSAGKIVRIIVSFSLKFTPG